MSIHLNNCKIVFFGRGLTRHKISLLQVHLVQQCCNFKSIQICPKTSVRWSACKSGSSLKERQGSQDLPHVSPAVQFCCPSCAGALFCLMTDLPRANCFLMHSPQSGNELPFTYRASSLLINVLNDSRNNSTPLVHLWSFLGYCCTVSCPWLHLALWAAQGSTHLFWALLVLLLSLDACKLSVPRFLCTRVCCAPSCWYVHVFLFWPSSIKLPDIGSVTIAGAQVSDRSV